MRKKNILDATFLFFLGAVSSLSLPPLNFFLLNFISFSAFFAFLFKRLNLKPGKKFFFFYGWLFGFGYFLTNLYWITISLTFDQNFTFLIPIALVLIPSFLSIFYGLVSLVFYLFKLRNIISAFFLFSLLFGITEFIRGHILTGFPWNLIVYSLSENINFISFISLVGTYSFNLLMISFFSAPAIYILRRSKKEIILSALLLLMPILFFSYSSFHKQEFLKTESKKNPYIVRIIGSNISLDRFYSNTQAEFVIDELIKISNPIENEKILFLWPEGIIPGVYQNELELYNDKFINNFNDNHLIGLGITKKLKDKEDFKYFNSFSLFDNKLNLIQSYEKNNLVPFGEFLPLEKQMQKFGFKTITNNFGSFTKGNSRDIIVIRNDVHKLEFLPLICYEIIYSGNLTKNHDFDFILNISEDGWFGKSIGPKQHFVHSIFRAIETGKYVVRTANNGMAAIINPLGEIEEKIDYGEVGFVDFKERRDIGPTFFSLYGNKIFAFLILLYIFLIFSFNRIKNE